MLHIPQGKPSCGSRPSHRISFLSRIALRCHLISWCMFGPLAILVHLHWAGVCLWLNMLDLVAARAWEKSFCCLFEHQLVVLLNAPLSTCCLIGFSRSQPPISRIMFCPLRLCFSPGTSKWCRLGTSGRGLAPSPSVANSLANLTCFYLMQSIVKWSAISVHHCHLIYDSVKFFQRYGSDFWLERPLHFRVYLVFASCWPWINHC